MKTDDDKIIKGEQPYDWKETLKQIGSGETYTFSLKSNESAIRVAASSLNTAGNGYKFTVNAKEKGIIRVTNNATQI